MNEPQSATYDNIRLIIETTRTWPANTEPTAEEWSTWFRNLDPASAETVAEYMLDRQRQDAQCYLKGHVDTIATLEQEILRLRPFEQRAKQDAFNQAWAERTRRPISSGKPNAAAVNAWLTWFGQLSDEDVVREVMSIIEHGQSSLLDELRAVMDRVTEVLGEDFVRAALGAPVSPIDRDQEQS